MEDLKKIQEFFSKPLEENVDKKYSDFLVALRDSGVTNMFGAAPYLQAEFGLDKREAREVLANWMRSFGESLNENAFVEAFKLEKALKGMGYDVKVKYLDDFGKDVFEIYFQNPADADDSIFYDAKELGYDNIRVFANPQESLDEAYIVTYAKNKGERPSSVAYKLRGSALAFMRDLEKDGYTTMLTQRPVDGVDEAIEENALGMSDSRLTSDQHRDLDYAVRGDSAYTFGNDPYADDQLRYKYAVKMGFLEEYNSGLYFDPDKYVSRDKAKEVSKTALDKVRDAIKKALIGDYKPSVTETPNEALADSEEKEANYDELYKDYKYKVDEAKPKKGHGEKVTREFFSKLKGKTINYKGTDYLVVKSDEAVLTLKDDDGNSKTINLKQFNDSGLILEIIETIMLGYQLNEKKLCKKGEAYRKRRMAAGEKSSAYLSGRAVKVCKGQMSGRKRKSKKK